MAKETKGYLLKVTFAQDGTLTVYARSKKPFGTKLPEKIPVSTDLSTVAQEFEPGYLPEILPAEIEVIHDMLEEDKFNAIMGEKGNIVFTSTASGKSKTYPGAWVDGYEPASQGLNDAGTAIIKLESAGGAGSIPSAV